MEKNIVALLAVVAVLGIATGAGGCKKKSPADNPRCRIFDQEPQKADQGALEQIRAAYRDVALIAECARAAGVTVEEWNRKYDVAGRVRWLGSQVESVGRNVIQGARDTIREVREGASKALDEGEKRMEDEVQRIRDLVDQ